MVSRTPRHQSQPRPSMPNKAASVDAWDQHNNNGGGGGGIGNVGNPSYQYDQRRAKSSMRYQSNGRGELPMNNNNRARVHNNGLSNGSGGGGAAAAAAPRPRAISASRLRQEVVLNHDDPAAVAKQILDLRERRESSTKRPSMYRSNSKSNLSGGDNKKVGGGATPRGLVLPTVGSNASQEEIQAEQRLRSAETKISGLLQELEELKFFQEIEAEQPAPTTPRTPRQPTSQQKQLNGPQLNGPPREIRASSPAARGGRLPPPPPPAANNR